MTHPGPSVSLRALVALACVAVVAALLPAAASATHEEDLPVQLVRVNVPTQADRDRLASLGLDLSEHAGDTYVDAVLHTSDDRAVLAANGFTYTVVIPDLGLRLAEINEINSAYAATTFSSQLPSGRTGYRHLADYETELQGLANTYPGLVRLVTLNRPSVEGRTIYGVEISENVESATDGKPTFLIMGLHHAREWPSGEHTMEFAIDLAKGYGSNSRITDLLKKARVIAIPVVNPDGFHQSRKWGDLVDIREVDNGDIVTILGNPGNAYKRKNCRLRDGEAPPEHGCEISSPGGYGTGVDLNRNYGGLWGGAGTSGIFASPIYRGAGPFSEPETQAVRELVAARHVTVLITNHTYSNLVLRPPGIRASGQTADEPAMKALGANMAAQNGYRNIHGWQLYDTAGTTEDWSYNATGGYGYTFEIGEREFHPPFAEVVDEYVGAPGTPFAGKGNREAFLIALEAAANPAHHSVIGGKAPTGAVLRLKKAFTTKTSLGQGVADGVESKLVVGQGNKYTWHINPSTRPEVMEHRVRFFEQEPFRSEPFSWTGAWTIGDNIYFDFKLPETDVGALRVRLDWATPDDVDLYVYYRHPDGFLVLAGSSTRFLNIADTVGEEALVEAPDPGDYLVRVHNYASVTPTFEGAFKLYKLAGEEVSGGNLVESYTLTCERPDGTVLQTATVTVDRGTSQKVDLQECHKKFDK